MNRHYRRFNHRWYVCRACGKQTFTTRRDVKIAKISFFKEETGVAPYLSCDKRGFHLGHIPPGAKRRDKR